nr:MAG TPA: hypothetical protein [Caudoviricetes sp.]
MCTTSTYQSLICVLPFGIVVEPSSALILYCQYESLAARLSIITVFRI